MFPTFSCPKCYYVPHCQTRVPSHKQLPNFLEVSHELTRKSTFWRNCLKVLHAKPIEQKKKIYRHGILHWNKTTGLRSQGRCPSAGIRTQRHFGSFCPRPNRIRLFLSLRPPRGSLIGSVSQMPALKAGGLRSSGGREWAFFGVFFFFSVQINETQTIVKGLLEQDYQMY